jgi:hypothetical protein
VASLLCSFLSPLAGADQLYKSVDAQGHVTYSDRPITTTAKKTEVTVQQGDATEAARLAKENQVLRAEDEQRKKQQANDDKVKAQQTQLKQAKCQTARDNYYRLKDAGHIYQRDADGNRVYYDDSAADAKREEARQLMTIACGA